MKILIICAFLWNIQFEVVNAQTIGEKCPDLVFNDLQYFPKKQIKVSDFKGKWLVLDFWNSSCGACIASFPHTNSLQQEFKKTVQFLLVGYTGSQYSGRSDLNSIHLIYERFRKFKHLDLSIAYDSISFKKFGITSCPRVIIIDPKGIVRGNTVSITKKDMLAFLNGSTPVLDSIDNKGNLISKYDFTKPLLTNGNGGEDTAFIYRSILAVNNDRSILWGPEYIADYFVPTNKLELLNQDLATLYRFAYTGKTKWLTSDTAYFSSAFYPDIEVGDKYLFDGATFRFNYNFNINRKENRGFYMDAMQQDLKRQFRYIVKFENQKRWYFKLIAKKETGEKLRTKDSLSKPDMHFSLLNFSCRNLPLSQLLDYIRNQNSMVLGNPPIFDATGINYNIDIEINALSSDLEAIRKELNRYGLDLIKEQKMMRVMVIRDEKVPPPSFNKKG